MRARRLLLGFLPRRRRRRYGEEIEALVDELRREGDLRVSDRFDLVATGLRERWGGARRAVRGHRVRSAAGLAVAAGVAAVLLLLPWSPGPVTPAPVTAAAWSPPPGTQAAAEKVAKLEARASSSQSAYQLFVQCQQTRAARIAQDDAWWPVHGALLPVSQVAEQTADLVRSLKWGPMVLTRIERTTVAQDARRGLGLGSYVNPAIPTYLVTIEFTGGRFTTSVVDAINGRAMGVGCDLVKAGHGTTFTAADLGLTTQPPSPTTTSTTG